MPGRARKGTLSGRRSNSARDFPQRSDPVLPEPIDAHPDFHPPAWLDELAPLRASARWNQRNGEDRRPPEREQVASGAAQATISISRTRLARPPPDTGGHEPVPTLYTREHKCRSRLADRRLSRKSPRAGEPPRRRAPT